MTVIVIMCDGTCVKKSFKKKAKAEEFASKCRKGLFVSMVIVRSK